MFARSKVTCLVAAGAAAGGLAAGVHAGVIEDIKADIAADPNNAELYVELAAEYESRKGWREAAAGYNMALALEPGYAARPFR